MVGGRRSRWPSLPAMMSWAWPGPRGGFLQDGVLGRGPVRLMQQRVAVVGGGSGKPEWVLGVLSAHAQAVLKPLRGHLVDCFRHTRGDSCGPLGVRMS